MKNGFHSGKWANDYYSFGSPMPGRQFNSPNYRYGFNGQEKDDEVSGNGNSYTAEFWQYDSRLGRRWNLDPKPMMPMSDYTCFMNNPIMFSDALGDTVKYAGSFFNRAKLWIYNQVLNTLSPSARANYKSLDDAPTVHFFRVRGDNTPIPGYSPEMQYGAEMEGSRVSALGEGKMRNTVTTIDFKSDIANPLIEKRRFWGKILEFAHERSHAFDFAFGLKDETENSQGFEYNEAKAVHAENVAAAEINRFALIRNLEYRQSYRSGMNSYDAMQTIETQNRTSYDVITNYYNKHYQMHRFARGLGSLKQANSKGDPRAPVFFFSPHKRYGKDK